MEAKCAKDADSLEQLYQGWVLMCHDNKPAQKWIESDYKDRVLGLRTESAKKMACERKKVIHRNAGGGGFHSFLKTI